MNVRSLPWNVRAKIRFNSATPSRTLTLAQSDGPEAYADFDPSRPIEGDESDETNLLGAIEGVSRSMIEAAVEDEATSWVIDCDTAYLVQGQTGKFVDGPTGRDRWIVKAFASDERAHDLIRELNHWCCHMNVNRATYEDPMNRLIIDPEGRVAKCPHDPGFRVDETGVLYQIVEVPLDVRHQT